MSLINREAAIEVIRFDANLIPDYLSGNLAVAYVNGMSAAIASISSCHTVDAVEVVRCKDCGLNGGWDASSGCYWCNGERKCPDAFCSEGKKGGLTMREFFDLETGGKCRDEAHANELYRAGHRIKVYHDGKPWMEWIPGSDDYYMFDDGQRRLVKCDERKCCHLITGEEGV